MVTLLALPLELKEEIASYLVARDVAALALGCRALKQELGDGNQDFWFRRLRSIFINHQAAEDETKFEFSQPRSEKINYWAKAISILSGKENINTCGICTQPFESTKSLRLRKPWASHDLGSAILSSGETVEGKCCSACLSNWFTTAKTIRGTFPEISLSTIQSFCTSYFHGFYRQPGPAAQSLELVISIPTLFRLVKDVYGIEYGMAVTPSHRLKAYWAKIRGECEAETVGRALDFMKDIYTRKYRHLHIAMTPEAYYQTFHLSLWDKVVRGKRYNTFTNSSLTIANDILRISELLCEAGTSRRVEAEEIADALHTRFFCEPGHFDIRTLAPKDKRILWPYLNGLGHNDRAFEWHAIYTNLYFDTASGCCDRIRCYWCLRGNGGKDTEDNRYTYAHPGRSLWPRESECITIHIITHHQNFMWKRPKNKILRDYYYSASWQRVLSRKTERPYSGTGPRPSFENEELEDLPLDFFRPNDCLSKSEYFSGM
ncbi:hypothetical protein TWF281_004075 [Arthrobotrys megalospora]